MDNKTSIQVACIQFCSHDDVDQNLKTVANLVQEAAQSGAKLIVIPETFFGISAQNIVQRCKELYQHGPLQDFCSDLAKKHQIYLIAGTIPLMNNPDEKPFASSLVFDQAEKILPVMIKSIYLMWF